MIRLLTPGKKGSDEPRGELECDSGDALLEVMKHLSVHGSGSAFETSVYSSLAGIINMDCPDLFLAVYGKTRFLFNTC